MTNKERKAQRKLQKQQTKEQQLKGQTIMSNEKKVIQSKEVPGFMSVRFEHEVTKTSGYFVFQNIKIGQPMWNQILAYFKWCYDTTKSECQVRLYVNPRLREWRAWAFPQEARTGMTAKEIECPAAQEQRQQFLDAEGWLYFGTAHHHCNGTAFQSSTDEANEKSQDGLHITVGKMDEARHDIHARLYISGLKFEPNMEWFWDVGDEVQVLPEWVKKLLPEKPGNLIAREQMCLPPPAGTEFPQQWKDNLVEIKPVHTPTVYQGGMGYGSHFNHRKPYTKRMGILLFDRNKCLREIIEWQASVPEATRPTDAEIMAGLKWLDEMMDDDLFNLLDLLAVNDVSPMTMLKHMEDLEDAELQKQLELEQKKRSTPADNGKGTVPTDYDAEDAWQHLMK